MTVLTRKDLEEGMRLNSLLANVKDGEPTCSCGRCIRKCTVAQGFDIFRKGEKVIHEDLTYQMIEKKYADWVYRYGYLLIKCGIEYIDYLEKEKK